MVDVEEINKRSEWIFRNATTELHGINLNRERQIDLLENIKSHYSQIPYSSNVNPDFSYYFENRFFTYADGICLYLMISHFRPSRIIEVGSGFSSALMLDINRTIFKGETELTFIEPFPDVRLNKLTRSADSFHLIKGFLQEIEPDFFRQLKKNDILFIDSSHVVKTGSELNYLFFDILPVLSPGVIIHFHDIFFPFEYPRDWINEGRSWNESYFLRAFLMHNPDFEIVLFSSYLQLIHKDWLEGNIPLMMKDKGSSLWLVKK